MKSRKPAPGQGVFDWGTKLKAYRRKWGVSPGVKFLITVLEEYAGPDTDVCYPSLKALSLRTDYCERQLKRLVAQAVELGLLFEIVERQGTETRLAYKIRRANYIHDFSQRFDHNGKPVAKHVDGQNVQDEWTKCPTSVDKMSIPVGQNVQSERTKCPPEMDKMSKRLDILSSPSLYEIKSERTEETPPPEMESRNEWGEVEEAFEKFGLGASRDAVRLARESGCSPEYHLQLVAWAESHRADWPSPEGVLYARVRNARPGQPVADGWPAPKKLTAEEIARQQAEVFDRAEAKRRADQQAEEAAAEAKRQADARERQRLEREFGLDLDTMPDHQRDELVGQVCGSNSVLLRERKNDPEAKGMILRPLVLRHMAGRLATTAGGK